MATSVIVIPTYNEALNIVRMISVLRTVVPDSAILVVDDGSPDGTADLVEGVAEANRPRTIHLLRRSRKEGLGRAYVAGFGWAIDEGYERVVQMDADFQHDPLAVPRLLAELDRGADIAIGSRYAKGASVPKSFRWSRRQLSRWANVYAQRMLGVPISDVTAGFKAHQTEMLARLDLGSIRADGYGFQIETNLRASILGGTLVEVPIAFGERTAGTSKMSSAIVSEAFRLVTRWGLEQRGLRPPGPHSPLRLRPSIGQHEETD